LHEIRHQRGVLLRASVPNAPVDDQVLALDEACLAELVEESEPIRRLARQ
jgi:hypothetical protein